jgi:hypothetical protein
MHIHRPPPPLHELLSARPPSARALPGQALPDREIPLPSSSMCGGYGGDRSCSSVTAISKVLRLSGYNSSPGQRPPSLWPPTRLFPAARAAASRRPGSSTRRCRHHMGRRRRGGVLAGWHVRARSVHVHARLQGSKPRATTANEAAGDIGRLAQDPSPVVRRGQSRCGAVAGRRNAYGRCNTYRESVRPRFSTDKELQRQSW